MCLHCPSVTQINKASILCTQINVRTQKRKEKKNSSAVLKPTNRRTDSPDTEEEASLGFRHLLEIFELDLWGRVNVRFELPLSFRFGFVVFTFQLNLNFFGTHIDL
eukprot:TRINITY_DN318_c0_g1_i3.p2 TRINITY_DN318_c0_g1~~TRINITY_DN318_c0_g1_i3.p2  ORF type:complete len:106 (+),score=1.43 TRINITY_DN318_c0_g1_i3:115-432(+)